jgi:hypothetical protein
VNEHDFPLIHDKRVGRRRVRKDVLATLARTPDREPPRPKPTLADIDPTTDYATTESGIRVALVRGMSINTICSLHHCSPETVKGTGCALGEPNRIVPTGWMSVWQAIQGRRVS